MFSKSCEYGIRATLYIASQSLEGKRVNLTEISEDIDSPKAFTAKVLQHLSKSNIINSLKGPAGGFEIDKSSMKTKKLSEIVIAFDGDDLYKGCGLGLKECSEAEPCPVHFKFKKIKDELKKMLETTSVYDLATGLKEGITFLKR